MLFIEKIGKWKNFPGANLPNTFRPNFSYQTLFSLFFRTSFIMPYKEGAQTCHIYNNLTFFIY